jgi:hypothetical protein
MKPVNWIDLGSFVRGIRVMTRHHGHVIYAIDRLERPYWGFWLHLWTPIWHEGRGPYISIGLGPIRFTRGY